MRTYSRKREEGVMIDEYEEKCRLCLNKSTSMTPIFPKGSQEITSVLASRIMLCVGLATTQDENLPSMICSQCNGLLEQCYSFRKLCQSSYQKLKSHLQAIRCMKHLAKCAAEENNEEPAVISDKTLHNLQDKLLNNTYIPNTIISGQSLLKPIDLDYETLQVNRTTNSSTNLPESYNHNSILKQCLQANSLPIKSNISFNNYNNTAIIKHNEQIENHKLIKTFNSDTHIEQFVNSSVNITTNMNSNVTEPPVICKSECTSYNPNSISERIVYDEESESNLVLILNQTGDENTSGLNGNQEIEAHNDLSVPERLQDDQQNEDFNENIIVTDTESILEVDSMTMEAEISSFISSSLAAIDILSSHKGVVKLNDEEVSVELMTEDGTLVTLRLEEEEDVTTIEPELQIDLAMKDEAHLKKNKKKKTTKSANTTCEVCGKAFSRRSAALRHLRQHSGEKPFSCDVCHRRFAQSEVCARHRLVHTEKRPFVCTECPKSFTQRVALMSHVRSHQDPSVRPLTLHCCTKCPKMFLYASGLTRHSVVHTDKFYECNLCDRKFKDRSSLLRHMKHTKHKKDFARS